MNWYWVKGKVSKGYCYMDGRLARRFRDTGFIVKRRTPSSMRGYNVEKLTIDQVNAILYA